MDEKKNEQTFEESNADLFDYSMDDAGDPSLDTPLDSDQPDSTGSTAEKLNEASENTTAQSEQQPSSGSIEGILPTTNEEEMKKLMQGLDREQAYREHKCWRQWITVIVSIVFVLFQLYATLSGREQIQ